MTALDTNVLVRFVVEDDQKQTARAARLIEKAAAAGERLWVSEVVVCELVWVLAAAYKVRRPQIAALLRRLLHAQQLVFAAPDVVAQALEDYTVGRGDFADHVISRSARAAGCAEVATFDVDLLGQPGFVAP